MTEAKFCKDCGGLCVKFCIEQHQKYHNGGICGYMIGCRCPDCPGKKKVDPKLKS